MYLPIPEVCKNNLNSSNPSPLQSSPGFFGIQNGADYLSVTNSFWILQYWKSSVLQKF